MIPLAMLFARMAEERQQENDDLTKFRMRGSHERQSQPFVPARPPEQQMAAPPTGPVSPGILARLFEAMK